MASDLYLISAGLSPSLSGPLPQHSLLSWLHSLYNSGLVLKRGLDGPAAIQQCGSPNQGMDTRLLCGYWNSLENSPETTWAVSNLSAPQWLLGESLGDTKNLGIETGNCLTNVLWTSVGLSFWGVQRAKSVTLILRESASHRPETGSGLGPLSLQTVHCLCNGEMILTVKTGGWEGKQSIMGLGSVSGL